MNDSRGWNLPETKATKAWVAGGLSVIFAFLVPLSMVLVDDKTLTDITQAQWVVIVLGFLAGLGVGGATYQTANKPLEN